MLKKSVLIYFIILSTSVFAQEVKLTITDLMVLGKNEVDLKEYLFSFPRTIRTDSKNNIYLQDDKGGGNLSLIKKYSSNGKYLNTIGQFGEGPGDFKRIVDFIVLKNDDLIIVDMDLQRLTHYDIKNNKFNLSPNVSPTINYPKIFQLGKDKILAVDNTLYEKDKNILFIKSFDWKTTYYDFGHPSLFIKADDPAITEKIAVSNPPLNVCVVNENKIAAVPNFYDGMLTFLINEKGKWNGTHFYGYKPEHSSYENVPEEDRKDMFSKMGAHASGGSYNKYAYKQHAKSWNIYTYKNKYILHVFSACIHPDLVKCYMDVFDMEGKYLGKSLLFEMTNDPVKNKIKGFMFLWKDKDDNFYVVQFVDSLPVIKKVKIDITL